MAKTLTIQCETLIEIKAILKEIKEKHLVNKIQTGRYTPSDRYVEFDKLVKKVDNLLENCKGEKK